MGVSEQDQGFGMMSLEVPEDDAGFLSAAEVSNDLGISETAFMAVMSCCILRTAAGESFLSAVHLLFRRSSGCQSGIAFLCL